NARKVDPDVVVDVLDQSRAVEACLRRFPAPEVARAEIRRRKCERGAGAAGGIDHRRRVDRLVDGRPGRSGGAREERPGLCEVRLIEAAVSLCRTFHVRYPRAPGAVVATERRVTCDQLLLPNLPRLADA